MSSHAIDTPDIPRLKWISYSVAAGAVILAGALWWLNDIPD